MVGRSIRRFFFGGGGGKGMEGKGENNCSVTKLQS